MGLIRGLTVFVFCLMGLISCTTELSTATTVGLPPAGGISIHDIQGNGHISPINGQVVKDVKGVVTAIRSDGFYLQETKPDNNPDTSEALLVFTVTTPTVKIGDELLVSGTVDEYYPGGMITGNLTITEIKNPSIKVLANGKALPEPVVIGVGGRVPPSKTIEDDELKRFEPQLDGIDFYESLESMLVQVNNAVVVGATNAYKEIVILADEGKGAGVRSYRGGIVLREDDSNPERIMLDDVLAILPDVNVGDKFNKPIVGVLDYNYGNYKILPKLKPEPVSGSLKQVIAGEIGEGEFSVSAFNVQNLDPNDGATRFDALAKAIVTNLKSPDILSLEEVQDNNGAIDGAVVDASETYKMIIRSIRAAGGPTYEYIDIAPEANRDGGEVGGNIRVGFLFRTDRGLVFNRIAGGSANNGVDVRMGANGLELTSNPGRIDPANAAYFESRKPLIAQFQVKGERLFVIGLHLNSKGADTPLYGRYQPPLLTSQTQRVKQADSIQKFISKMLQLDPKAKIVVLGDLNDFQFSEPLKRLQGDLLTNLAERLPEEQRYSYIYDGNGQILDHILISEGLKTDVTDFGYIHLNSEFAVARRLSDHDPAIVRFRFGWN